MMEVIFKLCSFLLFDFGSNIFILCSLSFLFVLEDERMMRHGSIARSWTMIENIYNVNIVAQDIREGCST